jgi:gamma-glutamylcyclotransferase (GGCT)/AIG2-like uncharacterized protein YtfP
MKIATYGTFRKGERRGYFMDYLRDNGKSEIMELSGLRMFVIGQVPGVVITDDPADKIVVELIEADLPKEEEEKQLQLFDRIEGVAYGLYTRTYFVSPEGESAILYTYAREPREELEKNYERITDWAEFQSRDEEAKEAAAAKAGSHGIY